MAPPPYLLNLKSPKRGQNEQLQIENLKGSYYMNKLNVKNESLPRFMNKFS